MPNWCTGTMRIVGKYDYLRNFFLNGLKVTGIRHNGEINLNDVDNHTEMFFQDMGENRFRITTNHRGNLYLINSSRVFLSGLMDNNGHCVNNDWLIVNRPEADPFEDYIITFCDAEAAWSFDAEELSAICERFRIGMMIDAEEPGMGFTQRIHIASDGSIMLNECDDIDQVPDFGELEEERQETEENTRAPTMPWDLHISPNIRRALQGATLHDLLNEAFLRAPTVDTTNAVAAGEIPAWMVTTNTEFTTTEGFIPFSNLTQRKKKEDNPEFIKVDLNKDDLER